MAQSRSFTSTDIGNQSRRSLMQERSRESAMRLGLESPSKAWESLMSWAHDVKGWELVAGLRGGCPGTILGKVQRMTSLWFGGCPNEADDRQEVPAKIRRERGCATSRESANGTGTSWFDTGARQGSGGLAAPHSPTTSHASAWKASSPSISRGHRRVIHHKGGCHVAQGTWRQHCN
jgi:hypothetical protein